MDIAPNNDDFDRQASRSKPCPPKLAGLIALVNMIPPEAKPPVIEEEVWLELLKTSRWRSKSDDKSVREMFGAAIDRINYCLEGMPETFRAYVWQGAKMPEAFRAHVWRSEKKHEYLRWYNFIREAVYLYTLIRDSREKLRSIIKLKEKPKEISLFDSLLKGSTIIEINEQGLIEIQKDSFTEAVEGVEAARIRECEACSRIFWAGRIDQRGCSLRCNDILRKRRYRARYKQRLQSAKPPPKEQREAEARRKSTKKGK